MDWIVSNGITSVLGNGQQLVLVGACGLLSKRIGSAALLAET
jgi:hypothetical protein